MMEYSIIAKFLKHLNLPIYKYWYILCCDKQTETQTYQRNENPYKSQNPSSRAFLQKPV